MSTLLIIVSILAVMILASLPIAVLIAIGVVGFMILILYAYAFGWQRG